MVCAAAHGHVARRLVSVTRDDAHCHPVEAQGVDVAVDTAVIKRAGLFQVCQFFPVELECDGTG